MLVQQLVPRRDDPAERCLAYEAMLVNPAIQNQIRTGKFEQVYSQLQTNQAGGARTMNDSLVELYRRGEIDADAAFSKCTRLPELQRTIGVRS
jgi:twitching motility protein PilT